MAYELGVDLGTTFSTVAIRRGDHIEMADLGAHSFAVPSVLYIAADARVLVGEAAQRRAATDPALVVREVKRRLGDTAPVLVGDTPYSPALLTAALLRGVVGRVVRAEGEPPRRVMLAHPANWGTFRRDVFAEAAALSGLETEFSFIVEPVAAARWHARHERVPVGAAVAVYDLGGGTFDAAVLRKTADTFEVLGEPLGLDRLGGVDFDEAILGFVDRCLDGALQRLDPTAESSARIMRAVRDEVVAAKEALSTDIASTVNVALPSGLEAVRITRREFVELVEPLVAQSIGVLQASLELAGVDVKSLHKVLLVGGASRVPLVAELIERELGVAASLDEHPKNAIALGAAAAFGPMQEPDADASAGPVRPATPVMAADPVTPAGPAERDDEPSSPSPSGDPPVARADAPAPPAMVDPAARAALLIAAGPDGATVVSLHDGATLVLGRDERCDLQVHDPRVSRRHARLLVAPGTLVVEDLGSSNHVFVDGERIERGALHDGQALRVGNTVAVVALLDDADGSHGSLPGPVATSSGPATVLFGSAAQLAGTVGAVGAPPADDRAEAFDPIGAFLLPEPVAIGGRLRRNRVDTEEYAARLEEERPALLERRRAVAAQLRRRHPSAGWGVLRGLGATPARAGEQGFLALTVGYGDVATALPFAAPELLGSDLQALVDEFLSPYWYDRDVPVVARFERGGGCLVAGSPEMVLGAARQLVAQLVLHHHPADLAVALTASTVLDRGPLDVDAQAWASVPHLRGAAGELLIGDAAGLQPSLVQLGSRRLVVVGDGSSLATVAVPDGTVWIELSGDPAAVRPEALCSVHIDPADGLAVVGGEAARGVTGPVLPAMASRAGTEALLAWAR
ncbi:MAG: Hsp70 family protein [Acidimicrobiales bacterium]|nr:Hsp70 family protein [Acidimicrobiales bacterium]